MTLPTYTTGAPLFSFVDFACVALDKDAASEPRCVDRPCFIYTRRFVDRRNFGDFRTRPRSAIRDERGVGDQIRWIRLPFCSDRLLAISEKSLENLSRDIQGALRFFGCQLDRVHHFAYFCVIPCIRQAVWPAHLCIFWQASLEIMLIDRKYR